LISSDLDAAVAQAEMALEAEEVRALPLAEDSTPQVPPRPDGLEAALETVLQSQAALLGEDEETDVERHSETVAAILDRAALTNYQGPSMHEDEVEDEVGKLVLRNSSTTSRKTRSTSSSSRLTRNTSTAGAITETSATAEADERKQASTRSTPSVVVGGGASSEDIFIVPGADEQTQQTADLAPAENEALEGLVAAIRASSSNKAGESAPVADVIAAIWDASRGVSSASTVHRNASVAQRD
ncbi:unnamed protein product, partial [Amoebophrya sp. A25]